MKPIDERVAGLEKSLAAAQVRISELERKAERPVAKYEERYTKKFGIRKG